MATVKKRSTTTIREPISYEQDHKPSNSLKIKIDDLKTFQPLTDNQK